MRIAIINRHPADTIGGSEIQCDLIARGLHERGHDVFYVAPHGHARSTYETPYQVMPVDPRCSAVAEAAIDVRPDVVYWRFNKHLFLCVVRRLRRAGIPTVFAVSHINDVTAWSVNRSSGLMRQATAVASMVRSRLNHIGFRYVDALTVLNRDLLGRVPVKDQQYVPNAMPPEAVLFEWPRPYCAWIASIKAVKRPEMAVQLASDLQPLGVDLLMIGPIQAKEYRWLEDRSQRPANCHYLGIMTPEEVNGVLAESLLLIHTCMPEGFGNVFIQAWLQGRPTISLGYDPCGYIAEKGLGLNANDDFSVFSSKVKEVVADQEKRSLMGRRAKEFAEVTFSIDTLVQRVESILSRVAGKECDGRVGNGNGEV